MSGRTLKFPTTVLEIMSGGGSLGVSSILEVGGEKNTIQILNIVYTLKSQVRKLINAFGWGNCNGKRSK